MGTKLVVLVSDLHCGSTVGLLGPDFHNFEGNHVEQNDFQKWLWDCWCDLWEDWVPSQVGKSRYALVVNGDLVDGVHHKSKEIISPERADHVDAACEVLEPAVRGPLFITEGTSAHSANVEHSIGARLDAVKCPGTGRRVFKSLRLSVHGCPGVVRHHMMTTRRPYLEGSGFSITMGAERVETSRIGYVVPRWFARAHRHKHGIFEDGHGLMCVTGAWQGLTRYGRKVVPDAIPNPSAIILDWRGVKEGELPQWYRKVYKPKEPAYVTL